MLAVELVSVAKTNFVLFIIVISLITFAKWLLLMYVAVFMLRRGVLQPWVQVNVRSQG